MSDAPGGVPGAGSAPGPSAPGPSAPAPASGAAGLADGEWHRLMRVTPLLRGGFALLALAGFVIAQFRERLFDLIVGFRGYDGDPVDWVLAHGWAPAALGIALLVIALVIALFYVAWRVHTFRVTDEVVEVRSGVLSRTHRQARLDRIQGIGIQRKLLPRLFGAAQLEIEVAGHDANVRLEYLRSAEADALRAEILRRASGVQRAERQRVEEQAEPASRNPDEAVGFETRPAGAPQPALSGVPQPSLYLQQRASEFLAPELDPNLAPPESVVRLNLGRLIGSQLLHPRTFWFLALVTGLIVWVALGHSVYPLFGVVPAVLGLGGVTVRRISRSLRYSIAATPDGVRVGYGLLSTSNDTLPPGRIHSIAVTQPISWRPFGWWEVRVNRASRSRNNTREQASSTVLPVGDRVDVLRVLALLSPALADPAAGPVLESGFARDQGTGAYTVSPRRAAVLRWFSWRRNGFALTTEVVLLRRGAIWRELVIVPLARMQSVAAVQGPLLRALRLASIRVHTVAGPITPALGALDVSDVDHLFLALATDGVTAAADDRSAHWGRS